MDNLLSNKPNMPALTKESLEKAMIDFSNLQDQSLVYSPPVKILSPKSFEKFMNWAKQFRPDKQSLTEYDWNDYQKWVMDKLEMSKEDRKKFMEHRMFAAFKSGGEGDLFLELPDDKESE
jgi:hypothetical protein